MKRKFKKNISYILQSNDNARFMASSLSNLVNNISERIDKIECKYGHDDKKFKLVVLHTKYATIFLKKQTLKMI